jgi:serine protease inhibitor
LAKAVFRRALLTLGSASKKGSQKNVDKIDTWISFFREAIDTIGLKEFFVDKPFLFYIYDLQNDIPIFVGRIVDPNGKLKLQ